MQVGFMRRFDGVRAGAHAAQDHQARDWRDRFVPAGDREIQDRSVAEETYDLTQPGMPAIPYPVVVALQTLLDFMAKEFAQAKNADARRFVDDRFIRELEESGFIAALAGQ